MSIYFSLLGDEVPQRFEQQQAEVNPGSFMPTGYVARHGGGMYKLDERASA